MAIKKRVDLKDKNLMITLPTDVSKSCNISECCLHLFKHSKRYNRAIIKTCHLPGYGSSTTALARFIIKAIGKAFCFCCGDNRIAAVFFLNFFNVDDDYTRLFVKRIGLHSHKKNGFSITPEDIMSYYWELDKTLSSPVIYTI